MSMPQPIETATNAPMLSTWRTEGALLLQRCSRCGRAVFYPRPACPHCHAPELSWFRAAGTGRIVACTAIHRGLPEPFAAEAPVFLAEIALAEDVQMIARIVAASPAEVTSGRAVRLLELAAAARYPLPTFRPA